MIYGNGNGGESIYGEYFNDENFQRRHACAGLLSMANKGRNSCNSQFFITLKPCPHLDGKHVVFGQVIDGMDVIRQIGRVPTDANERPKVKVVIFNCGDFETRRLHITEDPFKEAMNNLMEDRFKNEKIKVMGPEEAELYRKNKQQSAFNIIQQYDDDDEDEDGEYNKNNNKNNNIQEEEKDLELQEGEEVNGEEVDEIEKMIKAKMGHDAYKKFIELKSRMNEAKNLNAKVI